MKLSKHIDNFLSLRNLVLGAVVSLSLTYFYFERGLHNYNFLGAPEAKSELRVYEKIGTAYYREGGLTPWENLLDDDNVYGGTTVQTQEDGHVIFYFQNKKGRLEVSANTQILINNSEGVVSVDLIYGEIFINYSSDKTEDTVYARFDNKIFSVLNTDIHLRTDSFVNRDRLRMSVDYGDLHVDIDGKDVRFESGQIVQFSGFKNYTVLEPNIKVITPLNFERYSLSQKGNRKIRFAWDDVEGMDRIQLFWGVNPYDLKPYFKDDLRLEMNEFFVNLPQGIYYWRILGYSEIGQDERFYSKINKIFVKEQVPIEPLSPEKGVTLLREGRPLPIQFQWRNSSNFEKIFVEVSLRRNFSDLIYHELVENADYYILPVDETGEIFWRVSGFPHGSSKLISGQVNSFFIKDSRALAAPSPAFPLSSIQITQLDLLEKFLRFKWLGAGGKFKVVLESDSDESGKGYYWESNSKFPLIPFLQPGKYFWKVINVESKTDSGFIKFNVLGSGKLNWVNYEKGKLDWDPGPENTVRYMVKIMKVSSHTDLNLFYETRKNKKAKVYFAQSDKLSLQELEVGKYAVKVYSLSSEDKIIADSSIFYFSHE